MTSDRRADLTAAIAAHNEAQERARDEKHQAERDAADKQVRADAALYGTAGWEALSDRRRARAAQHTAEQAHGGGNDAA
ncbi:hypothetical protein ACFQ9U_23125 [Streptomyces sp. NPDC056568]|uniref:hypothetical protein n=1 Tax=Streptomyces sp. NPDC056568 TaxID=3345866 RepID=UPI00369BD6A3